MYVSSMGLETEDAGSSKCCAVESQCYYLMLTSTKLLPLCHFSSYYLFCDCRNLVEGLKREGNVNSIVASPLWKYDTQKCVDASPLVVSDGLAIIANTLS